MLIRRSNHSKDKLQGGFKAIVKLLGQDNYCSYKLCFLKCVGEATIKHEGEISFNVSESHSVILRPLWHSLKHETNFSKFLNDTVVILPLKTSFRTASEGSVGSYSSKYSSAYGFLRGLKVTIVVGDTVKGPVSHLQFILMRCFYPS